MSDSNRTSPEQGGVVVRQEQAHVLFMDIVGYTLLPVHTQSKRIRQLQDLVRRCTAYRRADEAGELIKLPRGDGMALVFFGEPLDAVRSAVEIGRALPGTRELRLRMGLHTGLVQREEDLNGDWDVSGDGINYAHRAMEPGDHGHILLTDALAQWVTQHPDEFPRPRDLGQVTAKHGARMHLYNLSGEGFGNPDVPEAILKQKLDTGAFVLVEPPMAHRAAMLARRVLVTAALGILACAAVWKAPVAYELARWNLPAVRAVWAANNPAPAPARASATPSKPGDSGSDLADRPDVTPDPPPGPGVDRYRDKPPVAPSIRAYAPDGSLLARGRAPVIDGAPVELTVIEVRIHPRRDGRGTRRIRAQYSIDGDPPTDLELKDAGPDTDPASWTIEVVGSYITVKGVMECADGEIEPFGPLSFKVPRAKAIPANPTGPEDPVDGASSRDGPG